MSPRLAGVFTLAMFICLAIASAASAAVSGVPVVSGYNDYATLGLGSSAPEYAYVPQVVGGISGVASASVGYYDTLALSTSGQVYGWGYNKYGELGDGTTEERYTPEQIPGLSGVSQVGIGYYSGIAAMNNGTVEDWGYGDYGELGVGSKAEHHSPVTVPGLEHATQVASSCYANYALLSNGTVEAWGYGDYGELGNGKTEEETSPVAVSGLEHVTAISAGCYYAMALLSNGTVEAWGYGDYGELGNGKTEEETSPVAVSGLEHVTAISAGGYFGLALTSGGTVDAWGYNDYHEASPANTEEVKTAEQIPGLANVTQIAAGGAYAMALLPNGVVEGWGYNDYGELGNGLYGDQASHEPLTLFPQSAVGLAAGGGGYAYSSLVIEGARAKVSTPNVAFGMQTAGGTSATQSVTVTNEGPSSLTISEDKLSGTGASAFRETADGCKGATLASGATCTVTLAFAPSTGGETTATLAVASSGVGSAPTVALSGTGIALPPGPSGPPILGALGLSPSTFRAAVSGASATAASASTGTFVVYTDSQVATTTFLVEEKLSGVKSHGKCGAAPKHRKKGAKRCTYYKKLGSFTHVDAATTNALRFTGRVSGRRLAAGTYRLTASAHSALGTSAKRSAAFKIER